MKVELWMSWVGGIISAILIFFIGIFVIAWICSRSKEFELKAEQDLFLWILGILIFAIAIGIEIGTAIH